MVFIVIIDLFVALQYRGCSKKFKTRQAFLQYKTDKIALDTKMLVHEMEKLLSINQNSGTTSIILKPSDGAIENCTQEFGTSGWLKSLKIESRKKP